MHARGCSCICDPSQVTDITEMSKNVVILALFDKSHLISLHKGFVAITHYIYEL